MIKKIARKLLGKKSITLMNKKDKRKRKEHPVETLINQIAQQILRTLIFGYKG